MKDIVLKIKMCDRKGEYTNSTFKDIILLASPDFLFNKKKEKEKKKRYLRNMS